MNNEYDILEKCLIEIEKGADVDTVLFRYPEFADELRPILEASVKAKAMSVPVSSPDVVRRNRAKVLQRAAEMREGKVKPASRGIWFASLRRVAVMLTIIVLLFVSGTGLVRAASNTIPGDNLYPVKRTWEDVLLLFTFNPQQRELLEFEHENERLEELNELFTEGRSAKVDFAGYVASQNGNEWQVSGISVVISPQTRLPDQPVTVGSAVRVRGQTQGDWIVHAERIELLPTGAKLPEGDDDEPEIEEENHEGQNQQNGDNSGEGSEGEAPLVEETKTPGSESESKKESFNGVVDSIDDQSRIWTINGVAADVSNAEIKGTPVVGASVKVEGFFGADGVFIVKKIEFIASNSDNGNDSGSDDNNSKDDNSNDDNSNDDNSNDDDNHNDNDGGNSGSGGGGGDDD